MTDAASFKELQAKVTEHDKDIYLGRQRMDQFELRIERSFQAIAKAEGESKVEAEHTRMSIDRLYADVNQIKGGISALKWTLPITITVVGGACTFILALLLGLL